MPVRALRPARLARREWRLAEAAAVTSFGLSAAACSIAVRARASIAGSPVEKCASDVVAPSKRQPCRRVSVGSSSTARSSMVNPFGIRRGIEGEGRASLDTTRTPARFVVAAPRPRRLLPMREPSPPRTLRSIWMCVPIMLCAGASILPRQSRALLATSIASNAICNWSASFLKRPVTSVSARISRPAFWTSRSAGS